MANNDDPESKKFIENKKTDFERVIIMSKVDINITVVGFTEKNRILSLKEKVDGVQ